MGQCTNMLTSTFAISIFLYFSVLSLVSTVVLPVANYVVRGYNGIRTENAFNFPAQFVVTYETLSLCYANSFVFCLLWLSRKYERNFFLNLFMNLYLTGQTTGLEVLSWL